MRVAVIGTGIAGNAAAWTLSKHYPVTVYDRELRPGGHSHTVTIDYNGTLLAVDIGFIVYNELNYPDLTFNGRRRALNTPEILKALGARFGVPVIRERIFGQDYARTLAIWRNNFRAAWPNLMPSGFDDRFRRLWEYYLAYCEAGFLSGNIDVRQVVFAKSG